MVTDPPYGIAYESGFQKGANRRILHGIKNDASPYIWWLPFAVDMLGDSGCVACFSRWDVQDVFMRAMALAGLTVRSCAVWDKCSHGMGNLRQAFAPSHESIIFATKGDYSFPGKRPSDVIRVPKVPSGALEHPNEKPVELMAELVSAICPPGGRVLDPFMGSGSTGVACARTGMSFTGIELDREYFATAEKRVAEAYGPHRP